MDTVTDSSKQIWPCEKWERSHACWAHLFVTVGLTPHLFAIAVIVVLAIWLTKKDRSWYMDDHGKEAANFLITWLIFMPIGAIMILTGVLIPVVVVICLIAGYCALCAAFAAGRGQLYRYPACLRFIR